MKLIYPALLFSSIALLSACAPMGERGNPPRGNDVEMGRDGGGPGGGMGGGPGGGMGGGFGRM